MTHLQNDELLRAVVEAIDDPVVTSTIFETAAPFIALQRLMTNQFCIVAKPLDAIQ